MFHGPISSAEHHRFGHIANLKTPKKTMFYGTVNEQERLQVKSLFWDTLDHKVILIQSIWKAYKYRREYDRKRMMIIRIQSYCRMVLAKRKFIVIKASCLRIQQWWIMSKSRTNYKKFIVKVQSWWRGYQCRKEYYQIQKSVVEIQKWFRYKRLQRIVRLQAWIRGCLVRRKLSKQQKSIESQVDLLDQNRLKTMEEAAMIIQSVYRQYQQIKRILYQASARKIQRFWRRYRTKSVKSLPVNLLALPLEEKTKILQQIKQKKQQMQQAREPKPSTVLSTLSRRELDRLTMLNTRGNTKIEGSVSKIVQVVNKSGARPPSPSQRLKHKLKKVKENESEIGGRVVQFKENVEPSKSSTGKPCLKRVFKNWQWNTCKSTVVIQRIQYEDDVKKKR